VSGIAAVWRLDGEPLDRTTLERVTERLAPRTADGTGTWLDGPVGLGHRTLHATPESLQQKLPLAGDTGEVVVTADARLDNRAELISVLGLAHRAAEGVGDGELVLRAWERWREACPAHLLGDFAFALWDARRRVLFCARDPAGVKPLYYHLGAQLFAIASETGALLALPDVPRQLDEVRIAAYLVPGLEDRAATFYQGIRRLPPSHGLAVTPRGGAPRAYWRLDPTRELRPASDAEHAEQFRELFTEAVRCRLRSAFPVAAALSGGLDSSSVVCVARAIQDASGTGPLPTYTARFPTIPRCDEGPYIAAVEARGGLVPRHLRADTLDPLGDLEARPAQEEETFLAPGYYMHRALYAAARADGARVFLEGTGGDMVVSHGTGYLHDLARHGRWLALGAEARRLARSFQRPTWRVLRSVAASVAPPSARRGWRRLQRGGLIGPPPIRDDFARRIGLDDRLRAAEAARRVGDADGARREHWRLLTSARLASTLETLAAGAEAVGVDLRDPYLDRRLMEFCLALPASQKIRRGRTRVVARHALDAVLPPEIRDRPGKAPIDLMLGSALAVYGRNRLDCLMAEAASVLGPYVPADTIRQVYRGYVKRGAHGDVSRVWRFAILTLWLRRAAWGRRPDPAHR
jgi:asparagine synthase (glutamine-hydrolysing)